MKDDILITKLNDSRWFRSKGRPISRIEILDSFHNASDVSFVEIFFTGSKNTEKDEESEIYLISDLFSNPDFLCDFLSKISKNPERNLKTQNGLIELKNISREFLKIKDFCAEKFFVPSLEQSNTCVFYDETFTLKFLRKLEVGNNLDSEVLEILTQENCTCTPMHIGDFFYQHRKHSDKIYSLGSITRYIPNTGSLWDEILSGLKNSSFESLEFIYGRIRELGHVTFELHKKLAIRSSEEITSDDILKWKNSFDERLERVIKITGIKDISQFHIKSNDFNELKNSEKIRVHGDYHLGQVLCGKKEFEEKLFIIDFEGEPARTPEERRLKYPKFKDIAGMLRSFSYAANYASNKSQAKEFEEKSRKVFLESYEPNMSEQTRKIVELFEIDKMFYEIEYESLNRPTWLRIPLEALLARLVFL